MTKQKPPDNPIIEPFSNKVFLTLRSLDEEERKRLTRYLRSPYFIQSRSIPALCDILIETIAKGKTSFNREKVWQKLFQNEPYDDVSFRKLCSDLLRQTRNFMAHESLAADPTKMAVSELSFIVDHKVEPLYKSSIREAKQQNARQKFRSVNHFLAEYAIERQYFSLMDSSGRVDDRANLEEISQNLDLFYWTEKLKISSSAIIYERNYNHQYHIRYAENLIELIRTFDLEKSPALAIAYYSYMTLQESDNLEHYYHLRKLLNANWQEIPQAEAIELVDALLHYCARMINQGSSEFSQEYFDLFANSLENGTFIVKGELSTWRFNNMIAAALRLGKLEWAEQFIQKYHTYLPAENRANAYTFNLARVYRYQKKFEAVLGLLRDVEYQDIGYNLISKTILTITYYELGQIDVLNFFLTSFRAFLERNKKAPYRSLHLNLIKYTRKLIRLDPDDKSARKALRDEIEREKAHIVNYEWLLEKLV